jgi:osmotically-inducible protein OsmY
MKNDRQLQLDVVERLEQQLRLGRDMIGVEVHHGTIKLAGTVRDLALRENAERVARQVDGVLNVVLDIDVVDTSDTGRGARVSSLQRPAMRRSVGV